MFRYERCSHQAVHCANRDRNMFILSTIGATSRGSFDHDQTKHVKRKVGDYVGEGEDPKIQNWSYCEEKCLVETWDDEE